MTDNDSTKPPQGERNPGASVLQKLRNVARATGEDTTLLLIRYVVERFLYRLSQSPYRERFVLRGATLFAVWSGTPHRPTRDVDLLMRGDNTVSAMATLLAEVCRVPVPEDGVVFLLETLSIEERGERRAYPGLHIEITAAVGTARPRLDMDVAFGEAVTPAPEKVELPTLLAAPRPHLWAYPRETVVAEKTEALVSLGINNTRLKDFFDLWYLSRTFAFAGNTLTDALRATFSRRDTYFPAQGLPLSLTGAFDADLVKQAQWTVFQRKIRGEDASLSQVTTALRIFLQPPLVALAGDIAFDQVWSPDTGWRDG